MLVVVVVMLFAIFALATLVIDFGFVRLTQRQMLRQPTRQRWKGCAGAMCRVGRQFRTAGKTIQVFCRKPSAPLIRSTFGRADHARSARRDPPLGRHEYGLADDVGPRLPTPATRRITDSGPIMQFTPTTAGGGLPVRLSLPLQPRCISRNCKPTTATPPKAMLFRDISALFRRASNNPTTRATISRRSRRHRLRAQLSRQVSWYACGESRPAIRSTCNRASVPVARPCRISLATGRRSIGRS